jgi:Cu(I)/Ag(I) efflux system protein CusF
MFIRRSFAAVSAATCLVVVSPVIAANHGHHDHGGHGAHGMAMPMAVEATGEVRGLSANSGKIKLKHDPVPALGWPAMVMDFKVQDKKLLEGLKSGDAVSFSFVPGESGNVVTAIQKRGR